MGEINEKLEKIEKMLEGEQKKPKEFKLPFSSRVNHVKAKKNFVTLVKINENGQIHFKRVQITDQTFMEDEIPRLAAAGYVLYHKKNPMIILPKDFSFL